MTGPQTCSHPIYLGMVTNNVQHDCSMYGTTFHTDKKVASYTVNIASQFSRHSALITPLNLMAAYSSAGYTL